MQSFPHQYRVGAFARMEGLVVVTADGLESMETAPPAEFGGPGNLWSPEALLVAAVVDCFAFTFRAIARASSLEWIDLRCSADGTLDRVERTTRFTEMTIRAELDVAGGVDPKKAERLLEKAEQTCLITNSLDFPVRLDARVGIALEE